MKNALCRSWLQLLPLLCLALCATTSAWAGDPPRLKEASAAIAKDLGVVKELGASDDATSEKTIYLFEESHASRACRLQIAAMMLRLHDGGTRVFGLEGEVHRGTPLDVSWSLGGSHDSEATKAREDAALDMLAKCEIAPVEFLAMTQPGLQVFGLENREDLLPAPKTGSGLVTYLLSIAGDEADDAAQRAFVDGLNDAASKKDVGRQSKLLKDFLKASKWCKDVMDRLEKSDSTEAQIAIYNEVVAEAKKRNLEIPSEYEKALSDHIAFLRRRSSASGTMVVRMCALADRSAPTSVAVAVGAAHTSEMVAKLRELHAKFVVIRPKALDAAMSDFTAAQEYERRMGAEWGTNDDGTIGRLLNLRLGTQKLPPTARVELATAQSHANAKYAAIRLARRIAAGGTIDDDLKKEIDDLPGIKVDWSRLKVDGHDVVLPLKVVGVDKEEREIWMRVGTRRQEKDGVKTEDPTNDDGTTPKDAVRESKPQTLEDRVIDRLKEVERESAEKAKEEKDGKKTEDQRLDNKQEPATPTVEAKEPAKKKVVLAGLEPISRDCVARFGESQEDVNKMGRISQ